MGFLSESSKILGAIPSPITTGLSIAGQIFGAVKGANAAKESQRLLNQKQEENKADYDNTANRSFLETSAAKDAVKASDEAMREGQKAVAGRSAITGASDEAVVAGQSEVNKNHNNAISNIAAAGTNYQDSQKRMYLARKDGLDNQQMGINQQKAEGAVNLMGNASDLLSSVTFNSGMKSAKPTGNTLMSKIPTKQANSVSVGGERQFEQPEKLR